MTMAVCEHLGSTCESARLCRMCGVGPLRTGFWYHDEHYCDAHEPPNFRAEYTDEGDDYWTEWAIEDDCDCPSLVGSKVQPTN